MKTNLVRLAAAALLVASPAAAQKLQSTQVMSVSPYAGYMTFGSLVDGPLGTSLTNASAPVYGLQANLGLGSVVSVVGNVGYSEPTLRVGIPIVGGIDFGKSKVLMYDAGLQLSAPGYGTGTRGIFPFVQAGVGAMRYDVEVSGLSRRATNTAFNAAVGADIPIVPNFGLRIQAKDYIGKFDFNEATSIDVNSKDSHNIALSAGLKLSF
jgi:outer membrane protein with beta-barrel domain